MSSPSLPPSRPAPARPPASSKLRFGSVETTSGHALVVYGPGGIGKTTLAATAPGPVGFFDLENSLPKLKPQLDNAPVEIDIRPVVGIATWQDLRDALNSDGWNDIRTIVIDSGTRAEEMAIDWTLKNTPIGQKQYAKSVEDYGYGKGYTHVYDTFLPLLSDLERHTRAGRNVIIVCHDCTANVPNPNGEDWIRYEPRLQSPTSGKASIRLRIREWADHVLFVGYDVAVKDGKGKGGGTRTIYPRELPHCMAKSRTVSDAREAVLWDQGIWEEIGMR